MVVKDLSHLAELIQQLKKTPRLLRQVVRFARLSLQLNEEEYSGLIKMHCGKGLILEVWIDRKQREEWREPKKMAS